MKKHITLNGETFLFASGYREDAVLYTKANQLAQTIFGISFDDWKNEGGWDETFCPYTLFDLSGNAVSNVFVSFHTMLEDGKPKRYLQLNAVMTAAPYRQKGLARFIIEQIIAEHGETADQIFLFANDSAADFYRTCGFTAVKESEFYQRELEFQQGEPLVKLDTRTAEGRREVLTAIEQSVPTSRLYIERMNSLCLLVMLWGGDYFYRIPSLNAMVALEEEGDVIFLRGVFSSQAIPLEQIVRALPTKEGQTLQLGFTPHELTGWEIKPFIRRNSTTFLFSGKPLPLSGEPFRFQELCVS